MVVVEVMQEAVVEDVARLVVEELLVAADEVDEEAPEVEPK